MEISKCHTGLNWQKKIKGRRKAFLEFVFLLFGLLKNCLIPAYSEFVFNDCNDRILTSKQFQREFLLQHQVLAWRGTKMQMFCIIPPWSCKEKQDIVQGWAERASVCWWAEMQRGVLGMSLALVSYLESWGTGSICLWKPELSISWKDVHFWDSKRNYEKKKRLDEVPVFNYHVPNYSSVITSSLAQNQPNFISLLGCSY